MPYFTATYIKSLRERVSAEVTRLLDTMAPAENAPGVRVFLGAITGDPVLCILIGAIVTWLVHSSVASVLLVMSLAYSQFISPYAAFALVLGYASIPYAAAREGDFFAFFRHEHPTRRGLPDHSLLFIGLVRREEHYAPANDARKVHETVRYEGLRL